MQTPPEMAMHMSLRDYFAAQALPGIVNSLYTAGMARTGHWDEKTAGLATAKAYLFADAMLEARKR
ncbi:MAG: hypothetical protein V4773_11990 [Verrucomicrobiota bacterium]